MDKNERKSTRVKDRVVYLRMHNSSIDKVTQSNTFNHGDMLFSPHSNFQINAEESGREPRPLSALPHQSAESTAGRLPERKSKSVCIQCMGRCHMSDSLSIQCDMV